MRASFVISLILCWCAFVEAQVDILEDDDWSLVYPCPLSPTENLTGSPMAGEFTVSAATGGLAEKQTSFRMGIADNSLLIEVRCAEPQMESLVANFTQRDDPLYFDDSIELFFDIGHDHKTYYHLIVNSLGAQFDEFINDMAWDGKWTASVERQASNWTARLRIPFTSFGCAIPAAGTVWGFNLCREHYAGARALSNWANVGGNFHSPKAFGHIAFVSSLSPQVIRRELRHLHREHPRLKIVMAEGYLYIAPKGEAQYISHTGALTQACKQVEDLIRQTRSMLSEVSNAPEVPATEEALAKAEDIVSNAISNAHIPYGERIQSLRKAAEELTDWLWRLRLFQLLN